jgi:hypothetical protein
VITKLPTTDALTISDLGDNPIDVKSNDIYKEASKTYANPSLIQILEVFDTFNLEKDLKTKVYRKLL